MYDNGTHTMSLDELDLSDEDTEVDVPDPEEAGPAILGRTPLIGSLRREQGLPVARDEVKDELDL